MIAVETVTHTPKIPIVALGDETLSAIDKAIKKRPNNANIKKICFLMNCDIFMSVVRIDYITVRSA